MTIHIFLAGNVISSTIVGVNSNPMNLRVRTPVARNMPDIPFGAQPPWLMRLLALQWPLVKNITMTASDIMTMLKKKILESLPEMEMLKFDTRYHTTHMATAMSMTWVAVKEMKKLRAVVSMKAQRGGSTI